MTATATRPRRLRRLIVAAVAVLTAGTAALGAVAGAGIGPLFNDVPPTHPFFDEIQSVAMNCIAQGYDDGTYRPGNDVTRQAMAAFLDRTGGRLGNSTQTGGATPTVGTAAPNTHSAWVEIADGSVSLPDNGCTNQVMIEGTAAVYSSQTAVNACHSTPTCNVELGLFAEGEQIGSTFTRLNTDYAAESMAVQGAYVQDDGPTSVDYSLRVRTYNVKPGQANVAARSVLGTFYPIVGRTYAMVAGG
jgi:hypothetical protein